MTHSQLTGRKPSVLDRILGQVRKPGFARLTLPDVDGRDMADYIHRDAPVRLPHATAQAR